MNSRGSSKMEVNGVKSMEKKKYKVLVSDSIDDAGIAILLSVAEVDVKTKLDEKQICKIIADYDALMVRSGTKVTEKIISCAKKLKIVGRAGVGVDNVDVKTATSQGIFVVNSPLGNTVAAAEHTLALMFALARNVPASDASMRQGKWDRTKFMGVQLQNKTLGIIGLGQVGSHVARVAHELGMHLLCFDPYVNEQKAASVGATPATLEDLFKKSDFVTLHVPLIPETKYLINEERIKLMKKKACIINVSRGGVVNEIDLAKALTEGRLGGAALDVFEVERAMPLDSPLLNCPNLILTPHLGASTHEAQVNVAVDVAQQIKETLLGSLPQSAVNIPGLRSIELQHLRPLLNCCDSLGRVAAQMMNKPIEQILVTLEGEFSEEKSEPLLLSVTNGVLSIFTRHRVNFVNVREVADRHKIELTVVKEHSHMKNSIKVELKNKFENAVVRGTTTEDGAVLLKTLMGFPIYMLLPESTDDKPVCMFYSKHRDVPGALANITRLLGDAGVNIANCHLGRVEENGQPLATCVFHVDGIIEESLLKKIKNECSVVIECRLLFRQSYSC